MFRERTFEFLKRHFLGSFSNLPPQNDTKAPHHQSGESRSTGSLHMDSGFRLNDGGEIRQKAPVSFLVLFFVLIGIALSAQPLKTGPKKPRHPGDFGHVRHPWTTAAFEALRRQAFDCLTVGNFDQGMTLQRQRLFSQAEGQFLAAQKIISQMQAGNGPPLAPLLIPLAELRFEQGFLDEAEKLCQEAFESMQKTPDRFRFDLARCLSLRSSGHHSRMPLERAEEDLNQAFDYIVSAVGRETMEAAKCLIMP